MSQTTIPMFQDSADHLAGNSEPLSLEDYNRTMLEYTHRQMSSFVDMEGHSNSSRSSQNSGNSGSSINGDIPRQANGPPPTSAGAAAEAMARQDAQNSQNSGHNAKSTGF
ncbi:hypothetical protein N7495_001237 [Penicillium taxi]|uniref:uncharacterized protein n=1 Tax=Penicillium taxi TaxID=168475 RepID=UPI0025459E71|nr:uncharacterized protein N7495_001237 [Penicillium taxi]KAJ5908555.1 hypothetical protein N7495_001237 [Penicillium taxi]